MESLNFGNKDCYKYTSHDSKKRNESKDQDYNKNNNNIYALKN